jgi:hypothetical protein
MSGSVETTEHFEKAAERIVLDAIDTRQLADFTSLPEPQRRISAEFLQRLISGSHGAWNELCCPLRIRGANIVGLLRPPSGGQGGGRIAVQFWECIFDSPVDLSGAEFLVLRFVDCKLPAFIGASLNVSAGLDLSGSQFSGVSDYESELSLVGSCAIHLGNARIGGKLDMSSTDKSRFTAAGLVLLDGARIDGDVSFAGALLDGCGAPAVSARSIVVSSNVNLRPASGYRFQAHGEVGFSAAQITGDLMCEGAQISNPDGRALHCEDLKVESVFLTSDDEAKLPFEARGRLNFLTAIIGGSFFMTNARLAPGPDYHGLLRTGGPVAINLRQARISNALAVSHVGALSGESESPSLREAPAPVAGWFLLNGAQVSSVLDSLETGWPAPGFLDLDGLVYERIRHVGSGDLAVKRIAWLRRQFPDEVPTAETFRPQPYEQLSRVLRQHGLTREANAIAVEKIRMRLESRVDGRWARVFPSLLMLISHHGYSSSRAVLSFLIFVLLGTVMYAMALFGFGQPFLPIEADPEPVIYEFAFGAFRATSEQGCPGLHVMHYALDAALPVIDLGQDLRCRFSPDGSLRWIWLLLNSLYVITGAGLSAVVVLTLTGVLRQD